MFLFKLWIFEINFETIISFIIGIIFGLILFGLIYIIVVVASLGNKKFIIKTQDDSLTEAEVKDLIVAARDTYKDKKLRGKTGKVSYCYGICKDLAYGIAARFYPKSKYPLLELTVDEAIELISYIRERVDEILGRRGLKLLRRIKVSFIADASLKSASVLNSRAFNVGKNVTKSVGIAKRILDVINPVTLLRKATMDNVLSIVLNKLCVIVITVVGEETYKIYSKKVLNKEVSIESDIDKIADELDIELANAKNRLDNKEISNEDYKLLTRFYNLGNSSYKYDSIFDADMNLKGEAK